jgi:hypothetical protein
MGGNDGSRYAPDGELASLDLHNDAARNSTRSLGIDKKINLMVDY